MQRSLNTFIFRGIALKNIRAFSISNQYNAAAPSDPIQKLFVDKVREYAQKSKTDKNGLAGSTAEVEKQFKDTLDRVDNQFNAKGVDMTQFPTFNFSEPQLEYPTSGVGLTAVDPEPLYVEDPEIEKIREDFYN